MLLTSTAHISVSRDKQKPFYQENHYIDFIAISKFNNEWVEYTYTKQGVVE